MASDSMAQGAHGRVIATACALYLVFFVYGSLVPLHWTPQPLADAWQSFLALPGAQWRGEDRVDVAVNFLLLVPLGFGLTHLASAGRLAGVRRFRVLLVLPVLAALSVAVEFAQVFFPPRDPSWTDVTAQWAGALAGMALHAGAGGRFRSLLDGLAPSNAWQSRCRRWLGIYFALMLAFSVMPLDLTLSPVELYRKWRDGGVILLPFGAPWPGASQFVYDLVTDVALWVPMGVLWRIDGAGRRFRAVVLRGLVAAALVEGAQLLVLSRISDVTDVLLAGIGVALGAWLADGLRSWSSWPAARQRRWLGSGALAWLGVAGVVLWSPFDFTLAEANAAHVADVLGRLPFQTYFFRGEFGALNEIVRKLLVFLPGGLLVAAWAARSRPPRARGLWLAALWVFAWVLEAGQLFLPSKTADMTDAVLGCLGAWAGWRIAGSLAALEGLGAGLAVSSSGGTLAPPAPGPGPVAQTAPAVRGLGFLLWAGLALLIWLAARTPGLPYNVAKLVPAGVGGALAAAGLAFVLWWIFAAPLSLLADRLRRWRLWLPALLAVHGLVAYTVLRLTVPLEMIHKIIGSPVLGWPGPLEDIGRYLVLHASLMLPLVGAALIVRTLQRPATVIDLLNWCFFVLLLFWPLHWAVVEQAATDNLVELMRGGGSLVASLALATGWGLIALAGSALAAATAGGRRLAQLMLAALALAVAPWLVGVGLEPLLVKYDRAFSALQFIVSAGRDRYATGAELSLRAGIALLGLCLLVAVLQWPAWRAMRAGDASAAGRKGSTPGGLAAA